MRRFPEIDSTNRYLLDQARRGAPEGLVAVADHQTAGRGRRDRRWWAPAGSSLLVSVLLRPALPPARLHLTAAALAVAACETCRDQTGVEPGLKWPNDLVVPDGDGTGARDRKLAGVLAEVDLPAVVVGLGLNVGWGPVPPPGIPADVAERAVTLEQAAGRAVDRDVVLDGLLARLAGTVADWEEVACRYRRLCVTVGRRVRVELGDETLDGTAVDLTDEGQLLVEAGGGRRAVSAGDVVHLH